MGESGKEIKSEREHAARDREIYRLAVIECRPRKEIGTLYDLSEGRIVHIVKEVDEQIRKEFPEYIARLKDEQTRQLRFVVEEAMQAWELSKKDSFEWTDVSGEKGYTSTTRKKQCGNSAYLDVVMKGLADIRKIWGVDAAKKVDVTGNIGFLVGGQVGSPSRDELLSLLAKRVEAVSVQRNIEQENGDES